MMKRFLSIIVILMFVFVTSMTAYCSWLTVGAVAVKRLAARSAIYNTATAGANVPMKLAVKAGESLTAGGSAWVNVLLPGSTLCKIAGLVACAGLGYATDLAWDALVDWANTKEDFEIDEENKTLIQTYMSHEPNNIYQWQGAIGIEYPTCGIMLPSCESLAECDAAIQAAQAGYLYKWSIYNAMTPGTDPESPCIFNRIWDNYHVQGRNAMVSDGAEIHYFCCTYPKDSTSAWLDVERTRSITPQVMEDYLEEDFESGLWVPVQEALCVLDDYYQYPYAVPPAYIDDMETMDGYVRDCISSANLTAVENAVPETEAEWLADVAADEVVDVGVLTPEQVKTAVERALAARGISDADIQAAIEAAIISQQAILGAGEGVTAAAIETAINNALIEQGMTATTIAAAIATSLDGTPPTAPEIDLPEKDDLTESLTGFMNSLGNLSILDALETVDIEESGATSVLCINYPDFDGGYNTAQIDFSGVATELATIGNILLSVISIIWIIWLFKE